jgi:hypothetical protein
VVSGEPNITPIFSRSWLMKMQMVLVLLRLPVSLRSAWRHEPGLEADVGVAHLALDLGPGREGRHRVDHDHVEGAGAHQHVGDLERLLPRVGLEMSS